jgi:hypothetical protein
MGLNWTVVFLVYDDYKFVTRSELEGLGLAHLIGTEFIRAYMHGFFLDMRLYHKVCQLPNERVSSRRIRSVYSPYFVPFICTVMQAEVSLL